MNTAQQLKRMADDFFGSSERIAFEDIWEEVAEFILPNQSGILKDRSSSYTNFQPNGAANKGHRRTRRLYDETAIKANQDLSSTIFSSIINPSGKIVNLRFRSEALNQNKEAALWLEDASTLAHEKLMESNLITELPRALRQYPAICSTALLHETVERQTSLGPTIDFKFKAIHMASIAWAENVDGVVDTAIIKTEMTYPQILERWGKKTPENIVKAIEKGKLQESKTVMQIIKPNKDYKGEGGLLEPEKRPYLYYYIIDGEQEVVQSGGYYEFPVYGLRWDIHPGEVYGRGPGHIALPTVRSLNKTRELVLQALAKAVHPHVLMTRRAAMAQPNFAAGKVSVVSRLDDIREMASQSRFDVAAMEVQEMRNAIRESFFLDKLLLPPRTEVGEMTAFEVAQRVEQVQKVLGATFGRLNKELLEPLVLRTFKSLLRAGVFGEIPEIILQSGGLEVDVVFNNQLSRSQNMEEITNVNAWMQGVAQLAQLDPNVLDIIDTDAIVRNDAKERGVTNIAFRSAEEVQAIRQQRQQQQAMQQMLEAGNKVADISAKTQGGFGG